MIKSRLTRLEDKILEEKICKYIGVPKYNTDWDFCVYGGFIRDIFLRKEPNDLDILVDKISRKFFVALLDYLGWKECETNNGLDVLYTRLDILVEPITYKNGIKTIQLIQPNTKKWGLEGLDLVNMYYNDFVANVDYTMNAVSYYQGKLEFHHPNTKNDLLNKRFSIIEGAKMFHESNHKTRKIKFEKLGWTYYAPTTKHHGVDLSKCGFESHQNH